jgi:hypothetical protein
MLFGIGVERTIPNNIYMTLALLAYAALAVMQGQARTLEKKGEKPRSGLH